MRTTSFFRTRFVVMGLIAFAGITAVAEATSFTIYGSVAPGATRRYSIDVGMYDNQVTVNGNGRTDLDCWVYEDGTLVDSDTDDTDYCILDTPGLGTHRLVIKNYGDVTNHFVIKQR